MHRSRPEAQAEHVGLEPGTDANRAADDQEEDGMTLCTTCKTCSNCGAGARRLVKGECRTCWTYRHRTGEPRPIGLIVAHARRVFEREEERKWLRRLLDTA